MTKSTGPDAAAERLMAEAAAETDIDLSIGEPDQKAPQQIVDATVAALRGGATGYTAKPGLLPLREALAKDVEDSTGRRPDISDVTVTIGGSEAVAIAIMAVCSPDRGILVPDPAWPNYRLVAGELDFPVHYYTQGPSGDDFFNLEEVEAGLQAGAKLVAVNSPSNPTAAVATPAAFEALAVLLDKYDAYALSDEAYESIVFHGARAASLYSVLPARTFVARTFSKTYSMTGFRVGSLVSPGEFRTAIGALHGTVTGCAMAAAQHAAVVALRELPQRGKELAAIYRARFSLAAEILGPWMPPSDVGDLGGLYLWIDARQSGLSSSEITSGLKKQGVIVSSGRVYTQVDGFVRLSMGAEEEDLEKALQILRALLDTARQQSKSRPTADNQRV